MLITKDFKVIGDDNEIKKIIGESDYLRIIVPQNERLNLGNVKLNGSSKGVLGPSPKKYYKSIEHKFPEILKSVYSLIAGYHKNGDVI